MASGVGFALRLSSTYLSHGREMMSFVLRATETKHARVGGKRTNSGTRKLKNRGDGGGRDEVRLID